LPSGNGRRWVEISKNTPLEYRSKSLKRDLMEIMETSYPLLHRKT
jgi:hypothetical protein